MPYTPDQKLWALQQAGYNPNQYDVDDDGNVSDKVIKQPTTGSAPITLDSLTSKPVEQSALSVLGRSALRSAFPTIAGGVGGAGGIAAASWLLGPEVGAPVTLAAMLTGSLGASAGAQKLQNSLATEGGVFDPQVASDEYKQHPYAAIGGNIAAMPLGGFSPSLANVGRAARTASSLALTGEALPIASELGSEVNPLMGVADKANLMNVALGATLAPATTVGKELVDSYRENRPINLDPKTLLGEVALGALFNKPNMIGKAVGFHDIQVPTDILPTKNDLDLRTTPSPVKQEGEVPTFVEDAASDKKRGTRLYLDEHGQPMLDKEGNPIGGGSNPNPDAPTILGGIKGEFHPQDNPVIYYLDTDGALKQGTQTYIPKGQKMGTEELSSDANDLIQSDKVSTDLEIAIKSKLDEAGLSGAVTPKFMKKMVDFAQLRGVKLNENNQLVGQNGFPINGRALLRDSITPEPATSEVNTQRAGIDTPPHELFHQFFNDLKLSKNPKDQALYQRALDLVSKSPEYAKDLASYQAQGKTGRDAEEFLTQEQGVNIAKRMLNLDEPIKPSDQWKKDFELARKAKVNPDDMTIGELRDYLSRRFLTDAPYENYYANQLGAGTTKGGTLNKDEIETKKEATIEPVGKAEETAQQKLPTLEVKPEDLKAKVEKPISKVFEQGESNLHEKQDYTPEDLTRYNELIDKSKDSTIPIKERFPIMGELEHIRNKYKGMGPNVEEVAKEQPESNLNPDEEQTPKPLERDVIQKYVKRGYGAAKEGNSNRKGDGSSATAQRLQENRRAALGEGYQKFDTIRYTMRQNRESKGMELALNKPNPDYRSEVETPEEHPNVRTNEGKELDKIINRLFARYHAREALSTIDKKEVESHVMQDIHNNGIDVSKNYSNDILPKIGHTMWRSAESYIKNAIQKHERLQAKVGTTSLDEKTGGEGDNTLGDRIGEQEDTSSNAYTTTGYELAGKLEDMGAPEGVIAKAEALGSKEVDALEFMADNGLHPDEMSGNSNNEKEQPFSALTDAVKPDIERIAKMDHPEAPLVAKGFTKFYENKRYYTGQLNNEVLKELKSHLNYTNPKELWALDNDKFQHVVERRWDMQDHGSSKIVLTPEETKIDKAVSDNLLKSLNLKNSMMSESQFQTPTPDYLPMTPSRRTIDTLTNKAGSPEHQQLIQDWHDYYVNTLGKSIRESEAALGNFSKAYDKKFANLAQQFGPIDKSSGLGIPRSWREKQLVDIMSRFNNRYARRLSYMDAIEKNPQVVSALKNPTGIGHSEIVRRVHENINGATEAEEAKRTAFSGLIRAGMLGPLTGAKDFVSNFTLGWQHMEPTQAIGSTVSALKDIKANWKASFEQGVNRENISSIEFGEGGIDSVVAGMRRMRDILSTVQGRNKLEQITRAIAMGQGRYLVKDNLAKFQNSSLSGQSKKFLEDFMPDYATNKNPTQHDLDAAAARYVESVQGTYDYRGLPHMAVQGSWAPVLSLARWNIEKMNNFNKYVIDPMTKGDFKPFLMQTLGMALGGIATEKLVEAVTGRKSKLPTAEEVKNLFEEGRDKDGFTAGAYKLMGMSSMSGYGGMLTDLARIPLDIKFNNQTQGYDNPTIWAVQSVYNHYSDLQQAIQNGDIPSVGDITNRLLSDYLQSYRLAVTHLSTEQQQKLGDSDQMRDLKIWKITHDQEVAPYGSDLPNPYLDKNIKDFKKTSDIGQAVSELPQLLSDAVDKAKGDPEQLRKNIEKLKENSFQTFPSPDSMPRSFLQYITWLSKTEGPDVASEHLGEYLQRNAINKVKSSLVP